jgi:hypothetical protein
MISLISIINNAREIKITLKEAQQIKIMKNLQ